MMLVLTISLKRQREHGGDFIFSQGHISPGIYARSFVEGSLTEEQLNNFRQEVMAMVYLHTRIRI